MSSICIGCIIAEETIYYIKGSSYICSFFVSQWC